MSAKKNETKIPKEANPDSGYLSGPIDYLPGDSGDLSAYGLPEESDDKQVSSVNVRKDEFDSGVVCLSELLASARLTDVVEANLSCAPAPSDTRPGHHSHPPSIKEIPPVELLFDQDQDGDTSLHVSAVHGCERSVRTLIKVCPNKDWLDTPNCYGLTPLHIAVMSRNATIARMLVLAGASLACRDKRGETPLHKATTLSDVKCIQALLTPVKELPQRKVSSVLEQKNYNGQACVHMAASVGHMETLHTLVYYGADIMSAENLAGRTALHIAAARGDGRMCQYLQRCEAQAARARDYAGRTPRSLAKRNAAARAFAADGDSDSETDDDDYDSESESLFEMLRGGSTTINVA